MGATTSDYLGILIAKIDEQISSHISKLIATDHTGHDNIAGMIKGLQKAKSIALEHGKKFNAHLDDDEYDGKVVVSMASGVTLS